jgi:hypothetical protein
MPNRNERRKYARMEVCCRLTYKFSGSGSVFEGECINIGGAGIAFHGSEPVDPGVALEVCITPDNPLQLALQAFAEVLRCTHSAPQRYEIACEIKGIK